MKNINDMMIAAEKMMSDFKHLSNWEDILDEIPDKNLQLTKYELKTIKSLANMHNM